MNPLPRIYPITDTAISGISHMEQTEQLVDGGARFLQLREKHAPPSEFYESAKQVCSFARERGITVVINDRVDIALAAGAGGVHLGQEDIPPQHARRLLGESALIGYSTHNLEQAIEAILLPIDYIAVGPVFGTASKHDPDPAVGIEGLRAIRRAAGNFPLVAIGGITIDNIREVFNAGADSAAVIGSLVGAPSAISKAFKLLNSV